MGLLKMSLINNVFVCVWKRFVHEKLSQWKLANFEKASIICDRKIKKKIDPFFLEGLVQKEISIIFDLHYQMSPKSELIQMNPILHSRWNIRTTKFSNWTFTKVKIQSFKFSSDESRTLPYFILYQNPVYTAAVSLLNFATCNNHTKLYYCRTNTTFSFIRV